MQTRHRIPTIFNLSMVDVLCCALGCVILLWLINSREAKRRAVAVGETAKQLTVTRGTLAATQQELASLKQKNAETLNALALERSRLASTQQDLTAARHKAGETAANLVALSKEHADLLQRLAAAKQAMALLEKDGDARKTQLVLLNSKVQDLTAQLLASADLARRLKKIEEGLKVEVKDKVDKLVTLDARLQASEELVKKLREAEEALKREAKDRSGKMETLDARLLAVLKELDETKKKMSEADRRVLELLAARRDLEAGRKLDGKELERVRLALAELKSGNQALADQLRLVRTQAENRFAGLELTGKKVIFLIDTSGSMKMRDASTLAPEKWPMVCDTVGKLIRSLPDMTHYQIITFSDSVKYLRGNEREWFKFDPNVSPQLVIDSLKKHDPEGGTKMAPALAEVFRFRDKGLDTIYLISDGLPNDDDNLPADAAKLKGVELTTYLTDRIHSLLKTTWNPPQGGKVPVRINTVGFYFDSPEVGAFLWALARQNDGSFVGMSRP